MTTPLIPGQVLSSPSWPPRIRKPKEQAVYTTTRLAALAALGAVVVHLYIAPEHLGEKLYIGVLFLVGSALLSYAAVQLTRRRDSLAWLVGAVVSAGMIVGFLLSRTTGLPGGYRERSWEAPFGPLSLLFEGGYLVLFGVATRGRRHAEGYIRGAAAAGQSAWGALDTYRRQGGRIRWDDWFRLWNDITTRSRESAPRSNPGSRPPSASTLAT